MVRAPGSGLGGYARGRPIPGPLQRPAGQDALPARLVAREGLVALAAQQHFARGWGRRRRWGWRAIQVLVKVDCFVGAIGVVLAFSAVPMRQRDIASDYATRAFAVFVARPRALLIRATIGVALAGPGTGAHALGVGARHDGAGVAAARRALPRALRRPAVTRLATAAVILRASPPPMHLHL